MRIKILVILVVLAVVLGSFAECMATEEDFDEGKLFLKVRRQYGTLENPLISEFIINGQTVDLYSTDTFANIDGYIKKGWNGITVKTAPQEPANDKNWLIFQIGPMRKDPEKNGKLVMAPVVWKFSNGTDWDFKDNRFTHALGPDVKEVTLTYKLFWDGTNYEMIPIQNGDYVLSISPKYGTYDSPIIATASVNGTPFTSSIGTRRYVVITSLLKPGINEVKLMTNRIVNIIQDNDINFAIAGPAVWSAGEKKFLLKPINDSHAMQGWKRNKTSGQLENMDDANAETFARTIKFMVKELPQKPTAEQDAAAPQQQAGPGQPPEKKQRSI